jgi:hypothetical protein
MTQLSKTKVFVSYARSDMAFADRLVAAMEARGQEVMIDRRDLPILEELQRELIGFIRSADAVVFLISPAAIASKWCEWEVAQVLALNKRLAPIVIEPVTEGIPEVIRNINFLSFTPPNEFDAQADKLVTALNTDIGWVKEHTRLGELARRWQERERSDALVLRGSEIEVAERWIASRPANAPRPTTVHSDFIQASRKSEMRRRRTWALALVITAVLAVTALLMKWRADRERDTALISQSRHLARLSHESSERNDYAKALGLAREGLPDQTPQRPPVTGCGTCGRWRSWAAATPPAGIAPSARTAGSWWPSMATALSRVSPTSQVAIRSRGCETRKAPTSISRVSPSVPMDRAWSPGPSGRTR